jgi:hypothetical protein
MLVSARSVLWSASVFSRNRARVSLHSRPHPQLTVWIKRSHWSIFEFLACDFPKTSYMGYIQRFAEQKRRAHAQCGGDQIHLLALYTRLSLLLRTLFSVLLHCRNARSTVKLTNFEVSDSNMHVGVACVIGPVLLLGAGSLFIHNSQPLLELSRGLANNSVAHAHGAFVDWHCKNVANHCSVFDTLVPLLNYYHIWLLCNV